MIPGNTTPNNSLSCPLITIFIGIPRSKRRYGSPRYFRRDRPHGEIYSVLTAVQLLLNNILFAVYRALNGVIVVY